VPLSVWFDRLLAISIFFSQWNVSRKPWLEIADTSDHGFRDTNGQSYLINKNKPVWYYRGRSPFFLILMIKRKIIERLGQKVKITEAIDIYDFKAISLSSKSTSNHGIALPLTTVLRYL
jgi:hypothetical protein